MGSTISHFYFVRSVLHLFEHIRTVQSVQPTLPQEVVSELAHQTHLDRDRIRNMFCIFVSIAGQTCRLTPQLLNQRLPGWSTNPLKFYLRRAIFNKSDSTTFPELAQRVALFCPESKFGPAINEAIDGSDAMFLDGATSKKDIYARQRLLLLFKLTDQERKGLISCDDLDRLIRCLLKTTIPEDTTTLIPSKIISEIARVVIISVHERNKPLCRVICSKSRSREAEPDSGTQASHRLVITMDMFLTELGREDLD